MIRLMAIASICALAAPAFAQAPVEPPPRFEGLEHQLQALEQYEIDKIGQDYQRDRERMAAPNSGFTAADIGIRQLEYERVRDQKQFEAEQQRLRVAQEREQADIALQNTRVPPFASVVVRDPEAHILPVAPPNTYYARVNGRYVLVDAKSQLVTGVLPVQPTDPTFDVPAGPRPMPDFGLPARRVAASSSLVIRDFGAFALPAPPQGQYYARVDGKIVLVDARTELPVALAKPG